MPTPQSPSCQQFFDSGVHVREDIDVYLIEDTEEFCFKPTGEGWCYANTAVYTMVDPLRLVQIIDSLLFLARKRTLTNGVSACLPAWLTTRGPPMSYR